MKKVTLLVRVVGVPPHSPYKIGQVKQFTDLQIEELTKKGFTFEEVNPKKQITKKKDTKDAGDTSK